LYTVSTIGWCVYLQCVNECPYSFINGPGKFWDMFVMSCDA